MGDNTIYPNADTHPHIAAPNPLFVLARTFDTGYGDAYQFWSNDTGWGDLVGATAFTHDEIAAFTPPFDTDELLWLALPTHTPTPMGDN